MRKIIVLMLPVLLLASVSSAQSRMEAGIFLDSLSIS